jgi:phage portal protein BeeE
MTSAFAIARERQRGHVKVFESQTKAAGNIDIGKLLGSGSVAGASSGSQRSRQEAYIANRNWVFVCANAIAKRLAGQQFLAGEVPNATENEPREAGAGIWRKSHRDYRMGFAQASIRIGMPPRILEKAAMDQDVELFTTHPILDSVKRPNAVQKRFEFLYFSTMNLLLTGESYWVGGVVKTDDGERVELWAVPTKWMTPIHDGDLFTGYKMDTGGLGEAPTIPPENVARTYLADPADPKSVMSPLRAINPATRTDDAIQLSNQQMMERGINPNLIITLGKVRGRDGTSERRPRMTAAQRRQIVKAVREIWGRTVNAGDPAVLDDFIESVHKLHNTPQEMDFLASSKITKERIFQAFGVNPFIVGEIGNANRAQAVEAERSFCNTVNPYLDAFSETMTDFVGPMFEQPKRLLVWIEKCEPKDPELDLKKWSEARRNDDVSKNEFRTMQLGLPPVEEDIVERNQLLSTVGGMTGSVQVLQAMGRGEIERDAARNMLMLFLELDEEIADGIVGEGLFVEPQTPALNVKPPAQLPPPREDSDETLDDDAPEIASVDTAVKLLSASVQGRMDALEDMFKKATG